MSRQLRIFLLSLLLACPTAFGQSVNVTMQLDTNTIILGQSTTLRVYAQVVPALQPNSDRIFSWYVDLLNLTGSVARANYTLLTKPASDNDPQISSSGINDGDHRRGIYDTFLNLPAAGVNAPVELISVPVNGLAVGQTRFEVQAGTGVEGLTDFLVAPIGGGDPMTGGDYTAANILLNVVRPPCSLQLNIVPLDPPGTPDYRLQLSFTPCIAYTHTIEYRDDLTPLTIWQALPGAPHNSGSLTVTNTGSQRYFRLRAE